MEKSMKLLFDQYNYIVTEEDFLNEDEIIKIEELIKEVPGVTNVNQKNANIIDLTKKMPTSREIKPSNDSSWLYDKILSIVQTANMQYFHMVLKSGDSLEHRTFSDFGSCIDVNRDWSNDYFVKKIRFNIQLTDGEHYDGGDLLIYEQSITNPFKASRKKGSITIFATGLFLHEVTPITSGSASSITGCLYGPPLE